MNNDHRCANCAENFSDFDLLRSHRIPQDGAKIGKKKQYRCMTVAELEQQCILTHAGVWRFKDGSR